MITWLAIKAAVSSAWSTFITFCRERWELLVGALVGVLGMLALSRNTCTPDKKYLEEIDKAKKDFQEATNAAKEKPRCP